MKWSSGDIGGGIGGSGVVVGGGGDGAAASVVPFPKRQQLKGEVDC